MLLTRLWSALLALLSAAAIAMAFLVGSGATGDFTDEERSAIMGIANGGLIALEADLQSSSVSRAPQLLAEPKLMAAVRGESYVDDFGEAVPALDPTLAAVANDLLFKDHPLVTVGLLDSKGNLKASTGLDASLLAQLPELDDYLRARDLPESALFSAVLGGKIHAVAISRKVQGLRGYRAVAVEPLDLGGTSFLRRVLGDHPAGIVRNGAILGEPIGEADPTELINLVAEFSNKIPEEGASKEILVGSGKKSRLAAIGRVPGPAGFGPEGAIFAVLSDNSLSAKQRAPMTFVRAAINRGNGTDAPIAALAVFLLVALSLSWWFPHQEAIGGLRKLIAEFQGLVAGSQHQIFHNQYRGLVQEVASNAAAAHESIRISTINEIETADIGGGRPKTRSTRSLQAAARRTRKQQATGSQPSSQDAPAVEPEAAPEVTGIDLPTDDGAPMVTLNSAGDDSNPAASGGDMAAESAPSLFAGGDDDGPSLLGDLDEDKDGVSVPEPALTPEPEPEPAPAPAPEPAPAHPRDPYFREVFEDFFQTKLDCGENVDNFTFEKFAKKLRKNTDQLMERDGTKDVTFSVYVKDGKAALKAKVVK